MFNFRLSISKMKSTSNKNFLFSGENLKVSLVSKYMDLISDQAIVLSNTDTNTKLKELVNDSSVTIKTIKNRVTGSCSQIKIEEFVTDINSTKGINEEPFYPCVYTNMNSSRFRANCLSYLGDVLFKTRNKNTPTSPVRSVSKEMEFAQTTINTTNTYLNDEQILQEIEKRFPVALYFFNRVLDYLQNRATVEKDNRSLKEQFLEVIYIYWTLDLSKNLNELKSNISIYKDMKYVIPLKVNTAKSTDINCSPILKLNICNRDKYNLKPINRRNDRNANYINTQIDSKVFLRSLLKHLETNSDGVNYYLSNPLAMFRDLIYVFCNYKDFLKVVDISKIKCAETISYLIFGKDSTREPEEDFMDNLDELNFKPLSHYISLDLFDDDIVNNFTTLENWLKLVTNKPSIRRDYNLTIYSGDKEYKSFISDGQLSLSDDTITERVNIIKRVMMTRFIEDIEKRRGNNNNNITSDLLDDMYYNILFSEFSNDLLGTSSYVPKEFKSFQSKYLDFLDTYSIFNLFMGKSIDKFGFQIYNDLKYKSYFTDREVLVAYRRYTNRDNYVDYSSETSKIIKDHCNALIKELVEELTYQNCINNFNIPTLSVTKSKSLEVNLRNNVTVYEFKEGIKFWQCFGKFLLLPLKFVTDETSPSTKYATITNDGCVIIVSIIDNKVSYVATEPLEKFINKKLGSLNIDQETNKIKEIIFDETAWQKENKMENY